MIVAAGFGEIEFVMVSNKKSLTVLELKRLLVELKEKQPNVCIRYRLIGEMWRDNFTRVISVVDNMLFLEDETASLIINVPNIGSIMQFEMDTNFQQFQAHNHYDVVLDQSFSG